MQASISSARQSIGQVLLYSNSFVVLITATIRVHGMSIGHGVTVHINIAIAIQWNR